ncbi:hypothetical protein [Pontivivens insulae]|uniref:Uncharacterized protein n=1 Tax=Pontivivens insulae TaxID=1639689 RepID=A0A2R8ACU9_9RHOB|nr:hypothetical protein [Pontivivens insulae]RED13908.1 hypothetical protein DFR53_1256 [Pontivivens insulae]SPF29982.1 hypothetical protein POI8812_02309 [Pontivivens insulae]
MGLGSINRGGKTRAQIKKDRRDVATGVGKELTLVGLYALKELTGVDLHHQPRKGRKSWEKKWGER